jgi:hypothetical protein
VWFHTQLKTNSSKKRKPEEVPDISSTTQEVEEPEEIPIVERIVDIPPEDPIPTKKSKVSPPESRDQSPVMVNPDIAEVDQSIAPSEVNIIPNETLPKQDKDADQATWMQNLNSYLYYYRTDLLKITVHIVVFWSSATMWTVIFNRSLYHPSINLVTSIDTLLSGRTIYSILRQILLLANGLVVNVQPKEETCWLPIESKR